MKKTILYIFLFISIHSLQGQDFYFSQFYSSPLNLNPALTGMISGDLRFVANYRNQNSGLIPFSTYSASYDMKILRSALEKDIMSVGGVFVKDDIAGGIVNSMTGMISLAYHKALDQNGNHYIALGMQGGFFQRYTDYNALSYGIQWTGISVDEAIGHGETFLTDNNMLVDMNSGVFWYHYLKGNSSVFAGASMFHLLEPEESYFGDNEKISRRIVAHGGTRVGLSDVFYIIPNFVFLSQNKARDMIAGTSVEYRMESAAFIIGSWYRLGESLIITAGFETGNFQLGLSYDFIGSEKSISEAKPGFEISLIYSALLKKVVTLQGNPGKRF